MLIRELAKTVEVAKTGVKKMLPISKSVYKTNNRIEYKILENGKEKWIPGLVIDVVKCDVYQIQLWNIDQRVINNVKL